MVLSFLARICCPDSATYNLKRPVHGWRSSLAQRNGTRQVPSKGGWRILRTTKRTTTKTKELSAHVEAYLSPVQPTLHDLFVRLPVEVKALIFAAVCHATTDKFHRDNQRHLRTTPFTLAHVCQEWRQIVLAWPDIWRHVSLEVSTKRYKTQMILLHEWLERSGQLPLSINLLFENEYEWAGKVPKLLIEKLISTSHRWEQIYMVMAEAWYSELSAIQSNVPLLVTASIAPMHFDCKLPSTGRKQFTLFKTAPSLRDMNLNTYYMNDVQIPWEQLTRLKIQNVDLKDCLYALARTPNLEICIIARLLDSDRIVQDFQTRLELPIKELAVHEADWRDLARLLNNLSLPSLDDLLLHQMEGRPEISDFPVVLLNLGCHLRILKMTDFLCHDYEMTLVSALQQIPTLEILEIQLHSSSMVLGYDFFPRLLQLYPTSSSSTETYLGNLVDFRFSGPVIVEPSFPLERKLVDALKLRLEKSSLRSFLLLSPSLYGCSTESHVRREFWDLDGLALKIRFGDTSLRRW
ncbi:hypothetical protein BDN70DRAFT_191058 [Pholiota conissans]|uniref:F-box domain-containing protein n=1 Tax=Pholiota conissans TaxID=109636 RepID=A0A9P5YWS2_9AGAR|nr:hypothetical protein BDN70DRAFT_191058 [Pholiota conissans]